MKAVFSASRRLAAEAVGTALLVATVVGSGIMAETLTRDVALQLLCNTLATGSVLIVLICVLGPVSGAHFNPVVTIVFALRAELSWADACRYVLVQTAGGIAGALLAHSMYGLPLLDLGVKVRSGSPQVLSEIVATFGLLATILGAARFREDALPYLVGLYISAAYWFTASTSFANPAATVGRSLTRTFAGIRPADVPLFIAAQFIGALAAWLAMSWLLRTRAQERRPEPQGLPAHDHSA